MWPWKRGKKSNQAGIPAVEGTQHAVIAFLTPEGDLKDSWTVDELEEPLRAEIERTRVGELDGFGQCLETGTLEVFTYGPDADRLAAVVSAIVGKFPVGPGSYLIKRYGDLGASEVRVSLSD